MEKIMVHGGIRYTCSTCGASKFILLEIGVEDYGRNGRPHQPSPFLIKCECGCLARDISGYLPFPDVRELYPEMSYFAYDKSGREDAHGLLRVYSEE